MATAPFRALRTAVLTVSDTRTPATDTSGPLVVQHLTDAGHLVTSHEIVPDDVQAIRNAMRAAIENNAVDVLVTTGGTGITARDVTPEALEPLITKPIPGFGELFRMLSFEEIGTSTIQSRAAAAVCERTLVFVLPGSSGAVRTAMTRILIPQLDSRHRPCNFAELLDRC